MRANSVIELNLSNISQRPQQLTEEFEEIQEAINATEAANNNNNEQAKRPKNKNSKIPSLSGHKALVKTTSLTTTESLLNDVRSRVDMKKEDVTKALKRVCGGFVVGCGSCCGCGEWWWVVGCGSLW